MVQGFNHNIIYKGVVFHVQTEDSGLKNPHITTLLYRDGKIIASKKTDYSDIVTVEMLEKVVEELMKEQHKDMLRRLKSGEFDSRALNSADKGEHSMAADNASSQASANLPGAAGGSSTAESPQQEQTLDEMILEYLASVKD